MFNRIQGGSTLAATLFLASSAIASIIGVRQFDRMATIPAVVISGYVASGEVITKKHLKRVSVDSDEIEGSVQNPEALIGKKVTVTKKDGEPVFPNEIKISPKIGLSDVIPPGKVLFSLSQPNLRLPISKLTRGDLLDVLVRSRYGVQTVAKSVQVIGVMNAGAASKPKSSGAYSQVSQPARNPKGASISIVLAVAPQDVYPLANISSRDQVSLVVHSAYDIKNGTLQDISIARSFREVEVVTDKTRKRVRVAI